jgi:hypothetical protein
MRLVPMLADFAVRLAFGLTVASLLLPWRSIPPRFFRIQNVLALGMLVLGALDQARAWGATSVVWLVVTCAVLTYAAAVAWGLGLPRVARSASVIAAVLSVAWMAAITPVGSLGLCALQLLTRCASGFLVGATLTAMLLGHYYLISPAMSIEPLKRCVAMIAAALLVRCALASIGLLVWRAGTGGPSIGWLSAISALLLTRWGVGFASAAVSVYLAYKTVEIRSTQSATGILYVTTIVVLFGELTSMVQASGGLIG